MKFGKQKSQAWPKSNYGVEHEKAQVRKRIRWMEAYMSELKARYSTYMSGEGNEILASDDETVFK